MLIDSLLAQCEQFCNGSCAGECGANCTNAENCKGYCDADGGCLEQVHWYPSSGGRSDYTCPRLLHNYVLHFLGRYADQILYAASNIDLNNYPQYDIFSIGCGAAPDLVAFETITQDDGKSIYYKGYDRNELWEPIHRTIECYADNSPNITAKLVRKDIFDIFQEGKPLHHHYNVVIIQYLISHLYNTGQQRQISQLFDGIVFNIMNKRLANSPFLIIINDVDSMNKGRNKFHILLDKLEQAGYNGNAYAKSACPDGDLGKKRWGVLASNRSGKINYFYKQCAEHDGAQLIVEVW